MRYRAAAAMGVMLGVFLGFISVPIGYAQSVEDQIQVLRKRIEEQRNRLQMLQQAVEQRDREAAQQQKAQEADLEKKVETAARQALKEQVELQGPAALLSPPPMPPSAFNLGVFASVDFSFMQLSGVETPFAIRRPPSDIGGCGGCEIPNGDWKTVDVDRSFTPRYTGGFYLPGGWGVVSANYLYYSQEGSASFSASDGLLGAGQMGNFDERTIVRADAENLIRMHQFDAQWMYPIQVTRSFTLSPNVGMRAVWWKQDVNVDYFERSFFQGGRIPVFSFRHQWQNRTDAAGPKIGLSGKWELMRGLAVAFHGTGGYLIGNWSGEQIICRGPDFSDVGCGQGTRNFKQSEDRGFPFVEGDFSLTYAFGEGPLRGLSLGIGYRIGTYFDLTSRVREVVAFEPTTSIFERHNVTYDAPYVRLKYTF